MIEGDEALRELGDAHLKKKSTFANTIGLPVMLIVLLVLGTIALHTYHFINNEMASTIIGFLSMLLIAHLVTIIALQIHEKMERRAIFGNNRIRKMYLYNWSGRVMISERLYYDLFTKKTRVTMDNLRRMKERVHFLCQNDKQELYLLKEYVAYLTEGYINRKALSITKGLLVAACLATIPVMLRPLFGLNDLTFTVLIGIVFVFYTIIYFYKVLTTDKGRLKLISLVIDSCIEDLETKREKA